MISNPQFIKTQLQNSKTNCINHWLMLRTSAPASEEDPSVHEYRLMKFPSPWGMWEGTITDPTNVDFPDRYKTIGNMPGAFELVGSCNGLICLCVFGLRFLLWNPTMRRCRKLPLFDSIAPDQPFIAYGFGYDECSDDYKLVGMKSGYCKAGGYCTTRTRVKMYSRKSNSWRRVLNFEGVCILHSRGNSSRGYFASGKIHWKGQIGADRSAKIVSLDLANKEFGEVLVPEGYERDPTSFEVGSIGGCLALVCRNTLGGKRVDFWILKEYGMRDSWTKLVSFPFVGLDYWFLGPFVFLSYKDELLCKLYHQLVHYSSQYDSATFSPLADLENLGSIWWMETYVETLVLPYARVPVQVKRQIKTRKRTRKQFRHFHILREIKPAATGEIKLAALGPSSSAFRPPRFGETEAPPSTVHRPSSAKSNQRSPSSAVRCPLPRHPPSVLLPPLRLRIFSDC